MKDYYQLRQECMEEVMAAGIEPGLIRMWTINSRAKSRWGLCIKHPDNTYEIQIAAQLLESDDVSIKACKETIIHEVLHTCKDCMKHTGTWKNYANIMNNKYGYDIKRCTSLEGKGLAHENEPATPAKYNYVCKKCGQKVSRRRASKFTKNYRKYGCGICKTPHAFIQV